MISTLHCCINFIYSCCAGTKV